VGAEDLLRAHDRRDGRGRLGAAGDGRGADGDTAALAAALRLAPERGELGLRYQPVLDTRRRRVDGVELLLRWRHPAQGAIPPDRFIPLADELGLLDAMALWSLRRAATELAPLLGRATADATTKA
jgi:EAL domain-containing protein (putative c-di-GMP-specific phosphodiesterase class I)